MNKFDKKIKEMAEDIQPPASYDQKVDGLLQSLAQKEESHQKGKGRKGVFRLAVCLVCIVLILSVYTVGVRADFFTSFKQTILDFLTDSSGEDPDESGVGSDHGYAESKPDLVMELSEEVIDSHSIYLLIKITAPGNVRFSDHISFDYFCFCKGKNYSTDQLIGGSISCEFLEVSDEMPNRATYVVSLVFDEELEEGSDVTVCFRDLTADPNSEEPTLLVSGVWSVTFPFFRTVTDQITVEGNSDMSFSFIDTTAVVERVELTPLAMVLVSDVSNFPYDELGVSDTRIAVRLRMIDGEELTVVSHDWEEPAMADGGSTSYAEADGKTYQRDTLEFTRVIPVSQVIGIYVEDLYIPLK
ncbi:MAG: hypothetical protein NC254_10455 [bacterium]|nr:hypothetical protein [bacterium]